MKNIKVYLHENFIKYPEEYYQCIGMENLKKQTDRLKINTDDFFKYKNRLYKQIENKDKQGKYIYIKGYATKHWLRYGYNHYTTKINDKEFTLICTDYDFGCDIPVYVLEDIINKLYKNLNGLKGIELEKYYEEISINGFRYKYSTFYDRNKVIYNNLSNYIRLYNYIDNKINMSYSEFTIPKKNGGYRTIESPNDDLKEAQRLIVDLVLKNIEISLCSTGFIEGKSIRDNASKHICKKFVLNIDLEDFFNTIGMLRVYNMFITSGIPHKEAEKMTKICTKSGYLPQGAPSSPYISNIICSNLDKRLNNLSKTIDGDYTRYADDITISTDDVRINKYIKTIEKIITEEGFRINYKKLRLLSSNTKQLVTGIIVNEKLNIDRGYIRKIRQELYYCSKYGIKQHMLHEGINLSEEEYINKLNGKINFIKSVNPNIGNKLYYNLQILTQNVEK